MSFFIKLTDAAGYTRRGESGEILWIPGKWQKLLSGKGPLCGSGWYHFYYSADLAVLLNPIHANIRDPRGWRAECRGKSLDDHGLKVGWTEARVVEEIELPVWTLEQKVAFAIYCGKEVYFEPTWNTWANEWLSGKKCNAKITAKRIAKRVDVVAKKAAWTAEEATWAATTAEMAVNKANISIILAAAGTIRTAKITALIAKAIAETTAEAVAMTAETAVWAIEDTNQKIDFVSLIEKSKLIKRRTL